MLLVVVLAMLMLSVTEFDNTFNSINCDIVIFILSTAIAILESSGPEVLSKKETLSQVFRSELCEISKSTFFHRTTVAASDFCLLYYLDL